MGNLKPKEKVTNDRSNEIRYTKRAVLKSKTYAAYADIINTVLADDTTYTKDEIDNKIKKFLGGD